MRPSRGPDNPHRPRSKMPRAAPDGMPTPTTWPRYAIHAETATFELRASEVASPRPDDQLTVDGETFVVQGEPERRDPDRLVWSLDVRPA
jgi:hypothetical protein